MKLQAAECLVCGTKRTLPGHRQTAGWRTNGNAGVLYREVSEEPQSAPQTAPNRQPGGRSGDRAAAFGLDSARGETPSVGSRPIFLLRKNVLAAILHRYKRPVIQIQHHMRQVFSILAFKREWLAAFRRDQSQAQGPHARRGCFGLLDR